MTDARLPDLFAAIARLPRGSGIVFRHAELPASARRALYDAVRRAAKRRGHVVLLADTPQRARAWHADGAHHRSALPSQGLRSVAAHDRREMALAQRMDADFVFISPVFATRSHPGDRSLGVVRAGLIAGPHRGSSIALGGMTSSRARRMRVLGFHGWAAIDALA